MGPSPKPALEAEEAKGRGEGWKEIERSQRESRREGCVAERQDASKSVATAPVAAGVAVSLAQV